MTDVEFIEELTKRTGKVLGKDFGIIDGRQTPYSSYKKGMSSASLIEGYSVWKRTKDGHTIQEIFEAEGVEKNLDNITNFLNED